MNENILIVEDNAIIAEDLADILEEAGYNILGIAETAERAIELIKFRMPDLVLLDITLKNDKTGVDVAKVINKDYDLPFIFITSYTDKQTLAAAITTKPQGYIVKPFESKDILPPVQLALATFKKSKEKGIPPIEAINLKLNQQITSQEYEVLKGIFQGQTNPEISAELFISINTVKTHIKRIYTKLEVDSKVKAVQALMKMH